MVVAAVVVARAGLSGAGRGERDGAGEGEGREARDASPGGAGKVHDCSRRVSWARDSNPSVTRHHAPAGSPAGPSPRASTVDELDRRAMGFPFERCRIRRTPFVAWVETDTGS